MTVNELIKELNEWAELGYGEKPVFLMNLKIEDLVELDDVSPEFSGNGIVLR